MANVCLDYINELKILEDLQLSRELSYNKVNNVLKK